jgi:putative heme transporter
MDNQPPPAAKPRSRTRLALQVVGSLVLVVAIFYYLLKGIDLAQVWADIRAMTWLEDLTLLAAAVEHGHLLAGMDDGRARAGVLAGDHDEPVHRGAVQHRTLGRAGDRHRHDLQHVRPVRLLGGPDHHRGAGLGVWNSFAKLGLPVLALALLALQGGAAGGRVVAGLVGIAGLVGAIVVFALILRSEELARRFGLRAGGVASRLLGLVRRPPVAGWEVATVRFRARTLELPGAGGCRVPITVATLVSHLSFYLVLLWRCGTSGSATPRSPGCRCWHGLPLRGC